MTNKPEERPITPNKSKGLVHAMVNRNGEIHEKCPDCRGECCKVVGVPPTHHQQRVLTAEDIERIGAKAAESGAVVRGGYQRY